MSKSIQHYNDLKLKKWLSERVSQLIDSNLITLTEKIHTNAKSIMFSNTYLEKYINQPIINHKIVVRPIGTGFTLVTGYKWLMLAKELKKPIEAIIISNHIDRNGFLDRVRGFKIPKKTEAICNISEIIIPRYLQNSIPRDEKYKKYEDYFTLNRTIDKPILVMRDKCDSSKVILQDGYIRYLILKSKEVKNIPVKFMK